MKELAVQQQFVINKDNQFVEGYGLPLIEFHRLYPKAVDIKDYQSNKLETIRRRII